MEKEQKQLATIEGARSPTPTSALTAPEKVANSVSGTPTPSPTATMIAELSDQDVAAVEAALVGVREAGNSGNRQAIAGALAEQAALLQALALKLLRVAGNEANLPRIQAFTNLSLRAFDGARKALAMLLAGQSAPQSQTNVQVNVGGNANELLERN